MSKQRERVESYIIQECINSNHSITTHQSASKNNYAVCNSCNVWGFLEKKEEEKKNSFFNSGQKSAFQKSNQNMGITEGKMREMLDEVRMAILDDVIQVLKNSKKESYLE